MNYDLSGWHSTCGTKLVINAPDGLAIMCSKCGVIANVEAISAKISPEDACKTIAEDRIPIGDQSINTHKGMVIK